MSHELKQIDGWRIVGMLARGGNAEVYRVVSSLTGEAAVLKIAHPGSVRLSERVRREGEMLSEFDDPAFPQVRTTGAWEDRAYVVLESLHPLALPRGDRAVARFALELCRALTILEARGIVHRDLKPSNLCTRDGRRPVLIDFGFAKRLEREQKAEDVLSVEEGYLVGLGTPGYSAPEQFRGEEVAPSADIHAVGVILSECFDGHPPACWRRIITRSTSSLPAQRFVSARDLAHAVRRRHAIGIGLCLAVAVLMALGVLAFMWHRQQVEAERLEAAERRHAIEQRELLDYVEELKSEDSR